MVSCQSIDTATKYDFTTTFERSNGTETATYRDVITYYEKIAKTYDQISMFQLGQTDSGYPLHLVVLNTDGSTVLEDLKVTTKNKVLINNGIHPGESDGVDASMLLLRDIVQNDTLKKKYKNTLIAVIPMYNIGGALLRNSSTRVNQNGPKEYGFRGNARNFDLNRDFIKQDTKNAESFARIFRHFDPDIFIDNHVSNGADYQYAITHLFTQHSKLGNELGKFVEREMRPFIETSLERKSIPITPYVNVWGTTPDNGWSQFMDSPRYSTGYTTLFNTLGIMVETHMLKPYKVRVNQTYELLLSALDFAEQKGTAIKKLRHHATAQILENKTYPIQYKIDRKNPTSLNFKGYEGERIDSKVTRGSRLFYNRQKPYTKTVNYYNNFIPIKDVEIPKYYIIKQGWFRVIERLKNNGIIVSKLKKDTIIMAQTQRVNTFQTVKTPFEGHYLHYNTTIKKTKIPVPFSKGDYLIDTNQNGVRYVLETLESEAVDSFFNWNFFDSVLQRKEGFSSYVFEDNAESFLKNHPAINAAFQEKIKTDDAFSTSLNAQLNWIYEQTPHYETSHKLIPIFKVFN